jgi:hypothetical protein
MSKNPKEEEKKKKVVVANEPPEGMDWVYGYGWPRGKSLLSLELACYVKGHKEEDGGLGAYGHFVNAWNLVWPRFEWNEWARLMVEGWCKYGRVSIMGHAAAGKTFCHARIAFLDWLAAPDRTMTSLATVTAEGLRLRMWGDLMRAVEELPNEIRALIRVYNAANRMQIMLGDGVGNAGTDKFMIEGMAVSRDKNSVGKIRGKHAPRRRVILDEADDMPTAIYDAFGNIMTDPDVKIVDMSNAVDKLSNFGKACTPKDGWGDIDHSQLFWETKDKGVCIHLDGLQNPNMKGKTRKDGTALYPYMLDSVRIDRIRQQFGEDSKEWWCMVRGFFPPEGMVSRVFPTSVIEKGKPAIAFDRVPVVCATLDPAFEHDDCVLHLGELGYLRNKTAAISCTKTHRLKPVESSSSDPKDYQIAKMVMDICVEEGVSPKHFIMDKSGNGRGVFAILQKNWSMDVQGISYGAEATERVFRLGETDLACDVVKKYVSELWFRARYAIEDGILGGLSSIAPLTIEDLSSRRYERKQTTRGSLMEVETKDDMKRRLGRSPDYGDAFVQFAELLCRLGGIIDGKRMGGESADIPMQTAWSKHREIAKRGSELYREDIIDADVW